jgi:polysaccharide pyruvyl transferase WcaK-like protein/glycosyltransferase involved in cell wall biosynthesis
VYGLHDLLGWGQANGVYVRYRVAEFIRRLYNDACAPEIRSFTPHEQRHLVSFFHLLLTSYEREERIRSTYLSILSLLTGGKRLTGCPYQKGKALNVDSRGQVACCAPKGNALDLPFELEEAHIALAAQRAEITEKHCEQCIHDYHDDPSSGLDYRAGLQRWRRAIYGMAEEELTTPELPAEPWNPGAMRRVLLTGWYGTETAGDIAILRGIISEYLAVNPELHFRVLSLHPLYTRSTIEFWPAEIRARVEVADYASKEAADSTADCDAVVMAGGPLMDIPETRLILCLFKRFADAGKPRVIEGCGVGPLHQAECRWNVCRLARLATGISVRDSASRDTLRLLGIRKEVRVRADPASTFLKEQQVRHHGGDGKVIRCFLRELTGEYRQSITPPQATAKLVALLQQLLAWYPAHRIELWAMHHFVVGNDDRLFAQQLVRAIGDPRLTFNWEPRTPREILDAMAAADLCVCMRFHSCVFAHEVGVPFLAIDYTAGGKIQGFLDDVGQQERLCRLGALDQLDRGRFESKVRHEGVVATNGAGSAAASTSRPVVLHVIEGLIGGGGARAMVSVARELKKLNGMEHRIVSLLPADRTGFGLAQEAGLMVLDRPDRGALHRALAEADLVLVHWWNVPELAELFRRELPPMRLALWLHIGGYHPPHVIKPELIEMADLTVACSPHTYAHPVFQTLDAETKEQRTAMVLAGADFERLEGFRPRSHAGFRVGYIGTLDRVKMHPDYVAMSCETRVPDVKFVVCGYGDMEWLKRDAARAGRVASFEFRGPVDDIRSVLEELDVYGYPLCPDTYAAAELNLQEAMFAGLPVVAFPYGGIGRLIQHGETGWLVNSAEEYARALEHLHAHPDERARLGANAAEFARRHWGATNAARAFDGLIGRLLSQPKRVRSWPASSSSEHGLDREFAIHPAARMFVESLGEAGCMFRQSMRAGSVEEAFAADAQIGRMPRSIYYVCGVRYRNVFLNDPYLNLWTGLACFEAGRHQEAATCFDLARRNGPTLWRAQWYYALSAEKCGKFAEAHGALDSLLRAAPNYAPAIERKRRLPTVSAAPVQPAPTLTAQQLVNQAQQFLKAGKLSAARESLARALELVPGQILLMELLADLDCRMGNRDAARELCEAILKREPGRATPRMLSIQKQVMRQPR